MRILIISLFSIAVCFASRSTVVQDQFNEDAAFDELSEALLNSADFHPEMKSHKSFWGSSESISGSLFQMLFDYAMAQLKAKLALVTVFAASKGGTVVLNIKNTNAILASWSSNVKLNATDATLLTSAAKSTISMQAQENSAIYTGVMYSSLQTTAENSKVRSVSIKSADLLSFKSCSAFMVTVSSNFTANVVDSKVGIANVTSTVHVTADKVSTIKWWTRIPGYEKNSKGEDYYSSEQLDSASEKYHDDYNHDNNKQNFESSALKYINKVVLKNEKNHILIIDTLIKHIGNF
uniref:Uncharacterized protein n=1 Tax=Ditylenchus dipsaci TaxID=166011 RepID=A0A915EVH3_9BILA